VTELGVPASRDAPPVADRLPGRAQGCAQPERGASGGQHISLGAAPALALVAAGSLVMIALGNNAAREGRSGALLFWGGLALIYAPIALRLLSASASRAERISLVLTLGVSLFMVKVLRNPTGFDNFDELGWWRGTDDVLQSGHFFSYNPIVVSTAGFPGLAAVTAAVADLTGLSIFHAGLIVVGAARVTLILGVFMFLERITGSSRAAGVGVAIYACNPSFLYFDAQFAYESLALAVAVGMLLTVLRWTELDSRNAWAAPGLVATMALLGITLTITHHITSLAVLIFLLVWTALVALRARTPINAAGPPRAAGTADGGLLSRRKRFLEGPGLPALLMAFPVGLWIAFVAGAVTVDELEGVITGAVDSAIRLVFGGTGPKTLFQGGGQGNTAPARALAIGAVIAMLALIPYGLRRTWRAPDSNPLWQALALTAVLYPLSLGLRLTLASSELSQRASEFVFLGLAFFAAILIRDFRWPGSWLRRRAIALGLTATATVLFLGGFVIGEMPATRQPGPYLVGAGARSITPEGRAAARFAASKLPADSRVLVDRVNSELLGSYGDLRPIFGFFSDIAVPRILFSESVDRANRRVIHGQSIAYIAVDSRLSLGVPILGYYVEIDEPNAFTREAPVRLSSLRKFNRVREMNRVYTNGPIVIYDSSNLPPVSR